MVLNKIDAHKRPQYYNQIVSYCNEKHKVAPDIKFIVVMHAVPTLGSFLETLGKLGEIRAIILKGTRKNTDTTAYDELIPKYGHLFYEDGRDGIEKQGASNFINKHIKDGERCVFIDIGGYLAPHLKALSQDGSIKKKLLGIVEDTKNGHLTYEQHVNHSVFPIISIALSKTKAREDLNVGRGIVDGAKHIMANNMNDTSRQHRCAVIGYGPVGRGIVDQLDGDKTRGITVHDRYSGAMSAATNDYRVETTADKKHALSHDVIFCATGNKAISGDDWDDVADGAVIISCTSSDTELDLGALIDKTDVNERGEKCISVSHDRKITTYQVQGKEIHLVLNGNAANFEMAAVNGPIIYAVLSALIISAHRIITTPGLATGSILDLDTNSFNFIEDTWYNVFLQSDEEKQRYKQICREVDHMQEKALTEPFNLPDQNSNFVGRKDLLSRMHQHIVDRQHVDLHAWITLSGVSGMGKTQLAIAYAYLHRQYYDDQILFFDAGNKECLNAKFKQLAEQLGIAEHEIRKRNLAIYKQLSKNERMLIIFDGSLSRSEVKDFLPEAQQKFTLIFTREKPVYGSSDFIRLHISDIDLTDAGRLTEDTFQHDALAQFKIIAKKLNYKSPDNHDKILYQLLEQVGFHPSSVTLMAKYLNKHHIGMTLKDYHDAVFTHTSLPQLHKILDRTDNTKRGLAIQHAIEDLSQDVQRLLICCAYFYASDISVALLRKTYALITRKTLAIDNEEFHEALKKLEEVGLIESLYQGRSVRIHPNIQRFILKDEYTDAPDAQEGALARIYTFISQLFTGHNDYSRAVNICIDAATSLVGFAKDAGDILVLQAYFPHLQILHQHAVDKKADHQFVAHLKYLLGCYYFNQRRDPVIKNDTSQEYGKHYQLTKSLELINSAKKLAIQYNKVELLGQIYRQLTIIHITYAQKYSRNKPKVAHAHTIKADKYREKLLKLADIHHWDEKLISLGLIETCFMICKFIKQPLIDNAGEFTYIAAHRQSYDAVVRFTMRTLNMLAPAPDQAGHITARYYFYLAKLKFIQIKEPGAHILEIPTNLEQALAHIDFKAENFKFIAEIFKTLYKYEETRSARTPSRTINARKIDYLKLYIVFLKEHYGTHIHYDVAAALIKLSDEYKKRGNHAYRQKSMKAAYTALDINHQLSRKNTAYARKFIRTLQDCSLYQEVMRTEAVLRNQGYQSLNAKKASSGLTQAMITDYIETNASRDAPLQILTLSEIITEFDLQDILTQVSTYLGYTDQGDTVNAKEFYTKIQSNKRSASEYSRSIHGDAPSGSSASGGSSRLVSAFDSTLRATNRTLPNSETPPVDQIADTDANPSPVKIVKVSPALGGVFHTQ